MSAMKDSITPKFVFAIAVFAAISFAVWAGMAVSVEQPAETARSGAFTTPF